MIDELQQQPNKCIFKLLFMIDKGSCKICSILSIIHSNTHLLSS